jgi:dihydrodipicolinate synthase/N-acetylneuraminate lyase
MINKKAAGVVVPMVTPLTETGQIDAVAVRRLVEHLVRHDTMPFILGTTGESASVPQEYRIGFVKLMVEATAGRTMTFAGISGNCLKTSIESAKKYHDLGVDVFVAHPPGFYPLSDLHLLRYYEELIEKIPGELIIYNIPPVTGISIPLAVIEQLSHHPRIIGLKDSEHNCERLYKSLDIWAARADFVHLTGWASVSAEALLKGSDGLVPSTGNLVPAMYKTLYDAAKSGDESTADRLQQETDEISAVYQDGFSLADSIAAFKVVLAEADLCQPYVLPPLLRLEKKRVKEIRSHFKRLSQKYSIKPV